MNPNAPRQKSFLAVQRNWAPIFRRHTPPRGVCPPMVYKQPRTILESKNLDVKPYSVTWEVAHSCPGTVLCLWGRGKCVSESTLTVPRSWWHVPETTVFRVRTGEPPWGPAETKLSVTPTSLSGPSLALQEALLHENYKRLSPSEKRTLFLLVWYSLTQIIKNWLRLQKKSDRKYL